MSHGGLPAAERGVGGLAGASAITEQRNYSAPPVAEVSDTPRQWWANHGRYNAIFLLTTALISVCYLFVLGWLIAPLPCIRMKGFAIIFGTRIVIALVLANVLYYLGPLSAALLSSRVASSFRRGLFITGVALSVLLVLAPAIRDLTWVARLPFEECRAQGIRPDPAPPGERQGDAVK